MRRGGTAVELMSPKVEGVPVLTTDGKRKTGWLKRLKKSPRKLNWWRSPMWKCLMSERSQLTWRGPRKALRGGGPKPVAPAVAAQPAAGRPGVGGKPGGGDDRRRREAGRVELAREALLKRALRVGRLDAGAGELR